MHYKDDDKTQNYPSELIAHGHIRRTKAVAVKLLSFLEKTKVGCIGDTLTFHL